MAPTEAASSTAATTRGAETQRYNFNSGIGVDDMKKYEIVKLTEDVMESTIDPKEWH